MRILVTNDDGIEADGLGVLARTMRAHGDVVVVAPDGEYSGSGAAIGPVHLIDPQVHDGHVEGIEQSWAVAGPPALCVLFARLGAFGDVDLVVSGINPGANVGRSVYHSGTVGAVLTARNGGISGIAVSQVVSGFGVEGQAVDDAPADQHWQTAADVASVALDALLRDRRADDEPFAVNLNVPNCEPAELKGWRYTQLATEPIRAIEKVTLVPHPDNSDAYKVEMEWGDADDQSLELDTGAVMSGYVSVSMLSRLEAVSGTSSGALAAALDLALGSD